MRSRANTEILAPCTYSDVVSDSSEHPPASAPRPEKQEQRTATEAIDEVAPGILRTQLPINFPGLGHVNMYVLEDDKGVAVVDPGLPDRASWKAVTARLAAIGVPLRRVHTVIVTHSHPDHYGGARRFKKETGAAIVTDRRFHLWWDPSEPVDLDPEDLPQHAPFDPPPWGGEAQRPMLRHGLRWKVARRVPRLLPTVRPDTRLEDAETIRLAGREWVAVHTPGHTRDHLCLFDPTEGVLLSGDHVLPTITPHISGLAHDDSLTTYFASLDKVAALETRTTTVLPAHGDPFTGLSDRVRSIHDHHLGRLDRLKGALDGLDRPATVTELSGHIFSPRAQGPLADSETYAHVEHLRRVGQADRSVRDGVAYYAPV